jgi:PKD repeat protein
LTAARRLGLVLVTAVICGVWASPAWATSTVAAPAFSATDNLNFTGAVTTFTTDEMSATAAQFSVTIDWGDGTQSAASSLVGSGGSFTVNGTHTYADSGPRTVTVTVHDTSPSSTASNHATVTVTDAPLNASGPTGLTVGEGASLSGLLAHVVDTDTGPPPPSSAYTASVDWGDGSAAGAGTVTLGASRSIDVSGGHTYAEEGSYTAVVTVTDSGGARATRSLPVTVIDAPVKAASALTGSAASGASFSGAVAVLLDTDSGNTLGDYTAQILWGDGSASAGTAGAAGLSLYSISGAHTYSRSGTYLVTTLIRDAGGQSDVAFGSLVVAVPPPPPPPVHCVVPSLLGKTTTAARRLLTAAHCSLGKTRRAKSLRRGQRATVVVAQSLRARTIKPSGTKVDVTLGRPSARRHA